MLEVNETLKELAVFKNAKPKAFGKRARIAHIATVKTIRRMNQNIDQASYLSRAQSLLTALKELDAVPSASAFNKDLSICFSVNDKVKNRAQARSNCIKGFMWPTTPIEACFFYAGKISEGYQYRADSKEAQATEYQAMSDCMSKQKSQLTNRGTCFEYAKRTGPYANEWNEFCLSIEE